jgi:type I restriction enzyme, S subunit
VREQWQPKRLGDVCDFRGGGTPSKAVDRYWRGDIPWVSPKDMKSRVVLDSIDHITSEAIAASAASMIDPGSILMVVRSGILARTVPIGVAGRAVAVNQDIKALCPKPAVDSWFLYYLLEAKMSALLSLVSRGATVHRLITDQIRAIEFMLPPLLEQRRIVAILDEAFEGIATARVNAEKNLQNARGVFESYLQKAYTVRVGHLPRERLEGLCEKDRLITYGVIKLGDPIESGVPCLRTSNVRWLDIDITGMKRIAPTLAAEYSRTILRGGEVLVNVRGTLGGVAVVSDQMAGWNVSREVAVVPVSADILDPEYAAFWIGSRTSQDWLSGVKKGAAYTGINIEDLRNLPVPLPALGTQREIVDDVLTIRDGTRRMEEIYKDKLAALDELKKSVLHLAFNGGLTEKKVGELAEAVA